MPKYTLRADFKGVKAGNPVELTDNQLKALKDLVVDDKESNKLLDKENKFLDKEKKYLSNQIDSLTNIIKSLENKNKSLQNENQSMRDKLNKLESNTEGKSIEKSVSKVVKGIAGVKNDGDTSHTNN